MALTTFLMKYEAMGKPSTLLWGGNVLMLGIPPRSTISLEAVATFNPRSQLKFGLVIAWAFTCSPIPLLLT